jgi:hypothetical protein
MKKKIATLLTLAVLTLFSVLVFAGEVYDRAKATTTASTGAGTWTNAVQDANLRLLRVSTPNWKITDTITVTRVTGDTTYTATNVIATITNSTSGGAVNFVDTDPNLPIYMKAGDKLTFSSSGVTGGVFWVEYLVQRH